MSDIIKMNKWTIDKYEWDAIMAWWWVFWKDVYKFWIIDACKSCLLQQAELKRLNEKWKEQWKDELSVRMWLHSWEAIVWDIGSKGKKMEYTALWDSVNLASRLEWVNKFYGTNICVSETVYEWAKDEFTFRYLDKIKVKGKTIWVKIYELVSYIWQESDLKKSIIRDFDQAMEYYFSQSFQEALNIFSNLVILWDKPSLTYQKRCEKYLLNPPGEGWDGIWVLDEK
jgi:adenylate cyclase